MTPNNTDTMRTTETAAFVNELAQWPVDTVNRAEVALIADKAAVSFPHWYTNCDAFRVGYNRWRKITMDECLSMRVGFYPRGRRMAGQEKAVVAVTPEPPQMTPSEPVAQKEATADMYEPETPVMEMFVGTKTDDDLSQKVSQMLGVDVMVDAEEATPYIPAVNPHYVEYGHFATIQTIIESMMFLPLIVQGVSGNGKSEMLEQVCAKLKRYYMRTNITTQTDEDDMLGGFRLVNGETKFSLGPIPVAMLIGAVVNLDEYDLGGAEMMCLQSVLEGKPLFLKKIGKWIHPSPGFMIVATANTNGRGDDGRYAHTQIQNDAMLERFSATMKQEWPEPAVEKKILASIMRSLKCYNSTLTNHLVKWAGVTRENYGTVCNEQIATRRLIHIVRLFAAVKDIDVAMSLALARFDEDAQIAFKSLWTAIHATTTEAQPSGAAIPDPVESSPAV